MKALLSRNNKGVNSIYMVFSLVLLLIVFLLVTSYAVELSGLLKEKQEKTFVLLTAHRIEKAFDLYERNGAVTTMFLDSRFYLYGTKPVEMELSVSDGLVLINASMIAEVPANGELRTWKKGGLYVLEVAG